MHRNSAKQMALGGVLAALAVVIMCLGGMLWLATFICPMLCCLILKVVWYVCGRRVAWAWYGAVAFLSVLLSPDKEAAAVFVFLGYYPIVKPWLDKRKLSWLWKTLLFNASVLVMYSGLIWLFGMEALLQEMREMGLAIGIITLILGNVVFWMLDRILGRKIRIRKR